MFAKTKIIAYFCTKFMQIQPIIIIKCKHMKTKTFTLLSSLTLLLALFLGTAEVKANTVVVDGNTISDEWTNGGATGFTASTGKVTSISQAFSTNTDGQLSPANNYTWYSIVSNEAITMTERTIEIGVMARNNYGGELIVTYSTDGTTYTNLADITTEIRSNDATANFQTITIDKNIPTGDVYLQVIGKAININSVVITGDGPAATAPILNVSPTSLAFGSLRANSEPMTVTVTNKGIGSMDVTISSDNTTDFTLSATSLTGIGAGESKTFDVTFNYNAESLGEKTANITVTPSYNAEDAKAIVATATAANAAVWEDFESGIPATWYNENDSWLNYVSGLSGYASPGYNSNDVLRTPLLFAEKDEALGFDVKIVGKYSSNVVKAKYSTDRVNWSEEVTYNTDGTYTIVAPATGYYWVEFTASQAGIDNITGWKVAPARHDTKLGKATIPAKGTAHGIYTASVVVQELGGSDETVTAELYFGTEKVAEQTDIAISGNSDKTIELSYLPTEEFEGNVYIKVSGENIGELETEPVSVTISETTYIFDEDSDVNPVISSNSVVKVKYTAQKGWNTIVMPFSLTGSPAYMNTIFGEGWTAYAIDGYLSGEVSFKSATYMAPSTPYLVYAPNAESHPDGVYLQSVTAGSYYWTKSTAVTKGDATFKGTFKPIAAPDMEGKYGITDEGKLAKGTNEASIKAYHAYLEVAGGAELSRISIEGFESGELTDLNFVKMVDANAKAIYTLSGQKVEKAKKGIYIVNGKKIVVR